MIEGGLIWGINPHDVRVVYLLPFGYHEIELDPLPFEVFFLSGPGFRGGFGLGFGRGGGVERLL